MVSQKPKKGNLLVAEPSLTGDVSFNRSVVLIAEHNHEGSVGFILNKPLDYTICDLVSDITIPFQVFNGGPVEQDNLYFIHKVPELIENSIEISDGIFWGGNFEMTVELINSGTITEQDIRFFLGYSGWGPGQLESEIRTNSWLSIPFNDEILFHTPFQNRWEKSIDSLGIAAENLSEEIGHA